ncbi:MAG: type II secretion system F family protein [Candidatus Moraniibacteriota bacterium]|nr:MAG: type II secretion system F family protein [Candidatus Moranbacteria bacterium]
MKKFTYEAKHNETGESLSGIMEMESRETLAHNLRAQGYILTFVQEEKKGTSPVVFFKRMFSSVPLKEKMVFARNLSIMIESGLPLVQAIDGLKEQTKNKTFQHVLNEVKDSIHGGNSFGDALSKHPEVFDDLFVNMVRVGELGGDLDHVLTIVATQLEKEHSLKSKVRGAMIYPSVILFAMLIVAVLMLTYILPQILGVFKDMDVELPMMTTMIMDLSEIFQHHSALIGFGFLIFIILFRLFLKTASGKRALSWLTLHLPVVRTITIKVNCSRFARIYSSLLRSGVGVVEALGIIAQTLSNVYYKDAILEGREQIQRGLELSKIIEKNEAIFPVLVRQMFQVGEQTGKSEEVLLKLAGFYEEEVDQITKNLSSVIEPLLMLVIGSAVGFFAVAMLQPMYSVMNSI